MAVAVIFIFSSYATNWVSARDAGSLPEPPKRIFDGKALAWVTRAVEEDWELTAWVCDSRHTFIIAEKAPPRYRPVS